MKYQIRKDLQKVIKRGPKKIKLYQVEALKDFGSVKKGDLGGYIASEKNLSQLGNCWIDSSVCVFENAVVDGDAIVRDNSLIFGDSCIGDRAQVADSLLSGRTLIGGDAYVQGCLTRGWVVVGDLARVVDCHIVAHKVNIYANALVENVKLFVPASFSKGAKIQNESDFLYTYASSNITFYKTSEGIGVEYCGRCFTIQEFYLKAESFKGVNLNLLNEFIEIACLHLQN